MDDIKFDVGWFAEEAKPLLLQALKGTSLCLSFVRDVVGACSDRFVDLMV